MAKNKFTEEEIEAIAEEWFEKFKDTAGFAEDIFFWLMNAHTGTPVPNDWNIAEIISRIDLSTLMM